VFYSEQIPDTLKVATAVSAPVLTFMGVSVEQWTFVLSAVVSILFIVEKLPVFVKRLKELISWMKEKYAERNRKV
jgi:Sec-independent protein translocase protein TatA